MFNRGSLSEENPPLSDSSFFKFVVANDFVSSEQAENTIGITLKIFFLVVFASFLIFMVRLIDKDRQRMDRYKRPVRRLRKSRQAWQNKQREALARQADEDADAGEESEASEPADEAEDNGPSKAATPTDETTDTDNKPRQDESSTP